MIDKFLKELKTEFPNYDIKIVNSEDQSEKKLIFIDDKNTEINFSYEENSLPKSLQTLAVSELYLALKSEIGKYLKELKNV